MSYVDVTGPAKPRLRLVRGMWLCGLPGAADFLCTMAATPALAFELWKRCYQ